MVSLDWTTERVGGVSLVELHLESDESTRVAVEPTHEGPLWPPRRHGTPAPGWSAEGWTGPVDPAEPRSLGYATPAEPGTPPVTVTEVGDAPAPERPADPRATLRALGESEGADGDAAAAGDETAPDPARDLDAIAARLDRAEALAAVSSVEAAGDAVDEAGGIDAVRRLAAQLERDRATLDRLHRRTASLRERADLEVPVEALERLV